MALASLRSSLGMTIVSKFHSEEGHSRACGFKLRYEQAAGELGGPGTPSHGQRQSRVVDDEDVI